MPQFTCPSVRFDLGEQAEMIRDSVAAFAAREIAPLAAEIDRTNHFPRELWPKLGELGLLGITVEEEYGGSGLGYLEHVVAMEEVSRASACRRPVLRRPLQSVRQPDPPLGHAGRRRTATCPSWSRASMSVPWR